MIIISCNKNKTSLNEPKIDIPKENEIETVQVLEKKIRSSGFHITLESPGRIYTIIYCNLEAPEEETIIGKGYWYGLEKYEFDNKSIIAPLCLTESKDENFTPDDGYYIYYGDGITGEIYRIRPYWGRVEFFTKDESKDDIWIGMVKDYDLEFLNIGSNGNVRHDAYIKSKMFCDTFSHEFTDDDSMIVKVMCIEGDAIYNINLNTNRVKELEVEETHMPSDMKP